jgi:hypothetical protein
MVTLFANRLVLRPIEARFVAKPESRTRLGVLQRATRH